MGSINVMKKIIAFTLIMVLVMSFTSCTKPKYSEEDFIGLTSKEVIDKYGEFDISDGYPPDDDGVYRNACGGYIVKEEKVGYLGTTPPDYFVIYFDSEGIVYRCAVEQGGWGG